MSEPPSAADFALSAIRETTEQLRELRIAAERRLGLETPEQRARRRAEDLARDRMEADVFNGMPSGNSRLSAIKRHNWARRMRGLR